MLNIIQITISCRLKVIFSYGKVISTSLLLIINYFYFPHLLLQKLPVLSLKIVAFRKLLYAMQMHDFDVWPKAIIIAFM